MVLLTGCGTDSATDAASDADAASHADVALERGDLPGCDAMAAALGGAVAGWTLADGDPAWDNGPGSSFGVSCTWLSPRATSGPLNERVRGGSLGMTLTVDPLTQSEAETRSIGWVVDDPAVAAIGGHLVFPRGALDFSKPVGVVAPLVIVGDVTVGVAATNAILGRPEETRTVTHRAAVDAAIALHRSLRD